MAGAEGLEECAFFPITLERLSKDFRSMKAEISTATLSNWVIEAADKYFRPIYEELHNQR